MHGLVVSVARDAQHRFSKRTVPEITLIAGEGVEGDAHCGATVKHRSRVAVDPSQPNLRQVHLMSAELICRLARKGFALAPSDFGENVTTQGVDLMALPQGAVLTFDSGAEVEVTGLRNPCGQIDAFRPGLLAHVLKRDDAGGVIRLAGIMGVVRRGGALHPGDGMKVRLPDGPHLPLQRV